MPQPNGLVDGPLTPQGLPAYLLRRGNSGLLVSMPHVGTTIPPDIAARMTPAALQVADTDWHLPLVYDLEGLDATILVATHSRLVIDLNRPPDDASLYPGRDTTGLIPVDTFRKEPVYRGEVPDEAETASRRRNYWLPYHQALDAELARLREQHTRVVLWEAHSIASELPRFFSGRLTDLNFGTADGASCAPELVSEILAPVQEQQRYTWVLNGRFKGGYITRRFGEPARGVHAVQLEMTQVIYMDEDPPFALRPDRCEHLAPLLRQCVAAAAQWARSGQRPL
ncbi:MAG TPA: N-formylglutamate deformylase [Lautropia sp.]|nr:N-formylglutamate deformylase [Lautropia sp.]